MKKNWSRLFSMAMVCAMLVAFLAPFWPSAAGSADAGEENVDQILLESMLNGKRHWVIETLVEDDYRNNPMAIAIGTSASKSLAQEGLDHYYGIDADGGDNRAAYRGMVNAMYFVYNKDEYVKGFFDELGELISWAIGQITGDEVKQAAETLSRTRQEMHYDNLLESIFTAKYTASDGTTLLDSEANLLSLQELNNTLKFLRSFNTYTQNYLQSASDTAQWENVNSEYLEEYGIPYIDAVHGVLDSLANSKEYDKTAAAKLGADLALVAHLSSRSLSSGYNDFSFTDYLSEYLEETGVTDLIAANGKTLKVTSTALEDYIALETISAQREILAEPLSRIASHADSADMRGSINNFERLLSENYNKQFGSFDSIQTYLRNNRVTGEVLSDLSKPLIKRAQKALHLTDDYMLGATVSKLTGIVSTSSWLGDQAIGLKSICGKTFELLYWKDLANAAEETYRADLAAYNGNKNEENAGKVIADLVVLQRVKLYGEKVAYALGSAPNNTWLGWVLDGESTQAAWDTLYQKAVDTLMAATVAPDLSNITVKSGETLRITPNSQGDLIGRCNGKVYIELDTRLAGGLQVNGTATLNLGGRDVGVGCVSVGNGGALYVVGGTLVTSEMILSSGAALQLGDQSDVVCTERLSMNGAATLTLEDAPHTFVTKNLALSGRVEQNFAVSGDISGSGGAKALTLNGTDQHINGTITSDSLVAAGNLTQTGTLTAGSMTFNGAQAALGGTVNAGSLTFNGQRATVSGSATVTGTLKAPSAKIENGKNILLSGGALAGNRWNGDLTLQNASVNNMVITGAVADHGGSVYAGNTSILRDMTCSGASSVQDGAVLSLYGTAQFSRSVSGGGSIHAYGDLVASNGISLPEKLSVCGKIPQDITGEFTIPSLYFANNGYSAKVWDTVTVTERLENPSGAINAVKPIYLAEGAVIGNRFNGSLSVQNLTLPENTAIGGNLTLRSGGVLSGSVATVNGTLILAGAGTADGCKLTVGGLNSTNSLTLRNDAAINVRGNASLGGTLTNPSELAVLGDLTMSGLNASGMLRVGGDTVVSGTTTLGGLTLDGRFRQEIAGSSFTVGNLSIYNTSGRPVKLGQTITVTGRYDNPSTQIEGGSIQGGLETAQSVTTDTTVQGALNLSVPLNVTGCTLTVNGPVSVPSVTLTNARLVVNGKLALSGSASGVDADSKLTVRGELSASSGTLTVDGALDVRGDMILGSTKLTGGTLALGGDLYGSGTLRPASLTLNGLIRQRISADNLHTGSVSLSNPSKGGILLEKKLYYSGTLDPGTTALFHDEKLIKEGE